MDSKQFWEAISKINLDALPDEKLALEPLDQYLSAVPPELLPLFQRRIEDCLYDLDSKTHFAAATENQTDDLFMAMRLWIIGQGKAYFNAVKKNPTNTPSTRKGFRGLLKAAERNWAIQTGEGEWKFSSQPRLSLRSLRIATGSNSKKWALKKETVRWMKFQDQRKTIDFILANYRPEEPMIGNDNEDVANAYLRQLQLRDFEAPPIDIAIEACELDPALQHGQLDGYRLGVDVARYMKLTKPERQQFFIESTRKALEQRTYNNPVSIIEEVHAAVVRTFAVPPYLPPRFTPIPMREIPVYKSLPNIDAPARLLTEAEELQIEADIASMKNSRRNLELSTVCGASQK